MMWKSEIKNGIFLLTIISYLFLFNFSLYGEYNTIQFEQIHFPQSVIFSISQDNVGFIWFATDDGLNRFDGYDVKVFKPQRDNKKSLSVNFIYCVYTDSKGTIWIGTRGGGLNKFDYDTEEFTCYTHNPDNPKSISNNNVYTIYEDIYGELWVGTYGGGLNKFDREKGEFIRYMNDPGNPGSISSNEIRTIAEDKKGDLWIGTDKGGLNKFDREKEIFAHYLNERENPNSISSNFVYKICPSATGDLWIATRKGFEKFSPETGTFVHYKNEISFEAGGINNTYVSNYVYTLLEDRTGKLWIGTRGGGLQIFDPQTGTYYHYTENSKNKYSVSHNNVFTLFQDRSGIIWLGTLGGGVNKYDPLRSKFKTRLITGKKKQDIHDTIYSFYEDPSGVFWIGTAGGGVARYDRKKEEYTLYQINPLDPDTLIKNDVYAMLEDYTGTFWVGTSDGLYSLDKITGIFTYHKTGLFEEGGLDNMVFSLFEDSARNLWVGTNDGSLNVYDREKGVFTYVRLNSESERISNTYVYTIYEDKNKNIWLGTGEGLKKLVLGGKKGRDITSYKLYKKKEGEKNGLSHDIVLSIHEDNRSNLWLGTRGGGLNKFDPRTERFLHYGEKDGLPNEIIYGILEDWQGYLWLSTNRGIAKFNPQTGISKNYDKSGGLQGDEFNIGAYCKTKKGQLFFGGKKGFNAFFPTDIRENTFIPPIVLTAFKQGGEELKMDKTPIKTDTIHLGWQDNFFEFEFVSLNFAQTEKNQYAYFLEGLDKEWYYSGTRRFGRYTGLPGGTYTLRIKGSNNDGRWNDEGVAVKIKVESPFFKAWWFYAILIYIIIIVIIIIYRIKVKQLKAEKESALLNREMDFSRKIMESIEYAKTIQFSILPSREKIARQLKRHFVIWKPRDIVGGDFYWFRQLSDTSFMIAVIDCTGHSVPGAFMTMITNSELNRVVDELYIKRPSEVLKMLNVKIRTALRQNRQEDVLNNGLDMGLCLVDTRIRELTFSGAKFSLFYSRHNSVHEIKGDAQRIGYLESKESFTYKDHHMTYTPQDYFYMTSDGYLEQCGGDKGLPLSKRRFKSFINKCYGKSMEEQKKMLEQYLAEYRKSQAQMDDIVVFGFRI